MTQKGKRTAGEAVLNFIGTAIIVIAIILCLALAVPRLAGIQGYTVLTGSMAPAVPAGSLVYAKAAEPASLVPGEIIVFYDGMSSIPVTHRLMENRTQDAQVITRGDANEREDLAPVPYQNIIGRVVLHIPLLGMVLAPMSSLIGKLAMAAMILAGALLCRLGSPQD